MWDIFAWLFGGEYKVSAEDQKASDELLAAGIDSIRVSAGGGVSVDVEQIRNSDKFKQLLDENEKLFAQAEVNNTAADIHIGAKCRITYPGNPGSVDLVGKEVD